MTGVDRVAVLTLPEAALSADSIQTAALASTNAIGADQADAVEYGDSTGSSRCSACPRPTRWAITVRVLICVLDSGFERSHEVFDRLEVREERDFVFDDRDTGYDPSQDLVSQADHGTAVLSVLAGYAPERLIGPAYESEFILAKTERIGSEQRSEEDHWCEAVEWAEAEGADVVSSSLSYPLWYRLPERDGRTAENSRVANIALERGLLVVNSTGNFGPGPPPEPPSGAGVLAVGSVDANGTLSRFSSIGPPGTGASSPPRRDGPAARRSAHAARRHANGTSFSTPLIAGCAAIVLSAHPTGRRKPWDALAMSADRARVPIRAMDGAFPTSRRVVYPQIEGRITDVSTPGQALGKPATISWEPAGAPADTLAAAAPSDSPRRGSVQADSVGAYVIPNLPDGTYRLTIEAPGYFRAQSELIQVPPGLGDVDFALRYRGE